jgi:medium-chain acyl-[acyl-carrier-protein] hydrolase
MANEKKLQKEYTIPFKVRSYEVDRDGLATLSSVCNYFQEAAGVHADHLQFDITRLQENGFTWVLYKMHVEVSRYPSRWEKVTVNTRPSAGDGLRAFRDYELLDENGARLAAAVSQWMVLNIKTRRPVRIPSEILEMGLKQAHHVIEPDKTPINPVPLRDYDQNTPVTHAGFHNLDMNGHVNNVTYIDWFMGYLPSALEASRRCIKMEVQYISECTAGDEIHIANEITQGGRNLDGNGDRTPTTLSQTLYRPSNEKFIPIAAAVSKWL